ncbi:hypothetical protein VE03_09439 [Pseudogymnoascus sp. 23342-1-I1]|nr:hypothetical protein VE03_09439 [Pseudogymnoascus sp. 23342-1-I1]
MAQRGLGALGSLTKPPNSPTPSSGSELSSAISDLESFDTLVARTSDRLLLYQKEDEGDDTITLLETALKYLPKAGCENLMRDIISCEDNDKDIKQLRNHFVDAVLKPMKATGGETPAVTPSSSKDAAIKVDIQKGLILPPDSSERNEQLKLKDECLRRDDHRCVITGSVDMEWRWDQRNLYPQDTIVDNTECAHILPHALGTFNPNRPHDVDNAAIIWAALYHFFPALVGQIAPDTINKNDNGFTLSLNIHKYFGQFRLYLEKTDLPNTYRLVWQENVPIAATSPKVITFTAKDPSVQVPNPHFLQVHCAVAKILRVFKVVWTEPGAGSRSHHRETANFDLDLSKHGELAYTSIRWFIIVASYDSHSTCLPILTYGGQGTAKPGVKPDHHAIIYTTDCPPSKLSGEPELVNTPIRIEVASPRHDFDPASRLNYAKVYTVEHNVKVCFVGRIHGDSHSTLKEDYLRFQAISLGDNTDDSDGYDIDPSDIMDGIRR